MHLPVFHVDAFATQPFAGNPAAVCPLNSWLDDELLILVAAENNVSETAYFVRQGRDYQLRWFTPTCEVKLCGHGTLASAFVIMNILENQKAIDEVRFETRFSGELTVSNESGLLAMHLPLLSPWNSADTPKALVDGLGRLPSSIMQIEDMYFAIFESEREISSIQPNFRLLETLHPATVAITAPGADCDFVSRYFAPSYGIPEDPVTGSSHCSLAPYWAKRLHKTSLHARQLSLRGGELWCDVEETAVIIRGNAVLTLRGEIHI